MDSIGGVGGAYAKARLPAGEYFFLILIAYLEYRVVREYGRVAAPLTLAGFRSKFLAYFNSI